MDLRDQLQHTFGDAYTLDRELGGGGMSRVFVADENSLGRKVVVKVLPSDMAAHVSLERFKREIMLAARLQHPHIVPLLSAGESDGLPYFTMPLVEGESLRTRLARHGELPVSEAMRILREIASALAYAHERGIVHRDIKPDNVLLSGGSAMVTDFGVAKALSSSSIAEHGRATSLGVALGTPAYMSPEQATADPSIDHRADIYALGVLAYELLTGQPPFAGRTPQSLLAAHATEAPEPIIKRRASLPPALAGLVMRCLEKRPADRIQTAAEIVHALDEITTPSGGMQPTSAHRAVSADGAPISRGFGGRNTTLGVAALVVIVAAAAWIVTRDRSTNTQVADLGKTLAVLPFATSGDTASDYLAEGISDQVRSELQSVQGLAVKPRGVATQFKGHTDDAATVAVRLGIGTIVTGTLRRAGSRIRITAELVHAADNTSPWSQKFEGEEKNLIALQDSIAHQIARALQARLSTPTHTSGSAIGTRNQAAYDLYMRGAFLLHRRGATSIRQSIALFEQAVAADSSYARAYALMAQAFAVLPDWSDAKGDSVLPLAMAAADRAISLDNTVAEAYAARGLVLAARHDWREAERALRRTSELDPHDASSVFWLALVLFAEGRFDESLVMGDRAVALDEFSAVILGNMAEVYSYTGRLKEAEADLRRAVALDAGGYQWHLTLAVELALSQDTVSALREIGYFPTSGATAFDLSYKALVFAKVGRRAEAEAIVHQLERPGPLLNPNAVAYAYLGLGELDRSLTWFIRGAELPSNFSVAIGREALPLRSRPLYAEFLRKMKLQDQPIAKLTH